MEAAPSHPCEVRHIKKFYEFFKATSVDADVVGLDGGAGSGKSVAVAHEMIDRLFNWKDYRAFVMRKSGPSLSRTTYQMFLDEMGEKQDMSTGEWLGYGYVEGVDYDLNRTERKITVGKNILWFLSADDREKIKSMNVNDAYIEEATEVDYEDYLQVQLRCRRFNAQGRKNQVILTYNPTDPFHWTKTEIVDKADGKTISRLHSTALDNPFLPKQYLDNLRKLMDTDITYYKIYALGEYATMANLIYQNYVIDEWDFIEPPMALGLDFGYNAPAAAVAVWYRDNELYIKELLYESHLTNPELADRLKNALVGNLMGVNIYCDSAEPKSIEEMCREGLNCSASDKAVKPGINKVKSFKLHIHVDSKNLLKELRGYKWKEDKNHIVYDMPVKINDHLMDATRYAVATSEVGNIMLPNDPLAFKYNSQIRTNDRKFMANEPKSPWFGERRIPGLQ